MYELNDKYGPAALIGSGAVESLGSVCRNCTPGRKAAVVTDDGIPRGHIERIAAQLEKAGFAACVLALPRGEENKNLSSLGSVLGFLYENGLTRADLVVGAGGGVVGDTAGFAAAVYLRGVPFVSVPTTVIAQTDSAYGGKTGVDLLKGKNLVGAFRRPSFIVCDTDFLRTLPENERVSGMGEVIKYGAIADPAILDKVGAGLPSDELVFACASIKQRCVDADEFDRGDRRILNFGHTFGHAFEAASGFTLSHGRAVALGMLAAVRLGERLGVTSEGVYEPIEAACERAGLETHPEGLIKEALPLLALDKKSDGKRIDFVLIRELGKPERMKLSPDEIAGLMR